MKTFLLTSDSSKPPSFGYRCKSALEKLGHEVETFNYRKLQFHRTKITNNLLNKHILNQSLNSNPDYFIIIKGESINNNIIKKISNSGIKTINWCLDDPFSKNPVNNVQNRNEYDYFFVFDPYYVPKLKESGQPNAHYLACCVDPEVHKEAIIIEKRKYPIELSFLGTYQKNRQELLEKLSQFKPKIWGYHWNKVNKKSPIYQGIQKQQFHGNKSVDDVNRMCTVFNNSKINLNIHYPHSIESVNLRTFEISATKSFQLCDNFKEIPNLYKPNKEIVTYDNVEELKEKIEYYLGNKEERHKISERAYKRTIKDHTFVNRFKEMFSKIK